jgi:hypothetical protein
MTSRLGTGIEKLFLRCISFHTLPLKTLPIQIIPLPLHLQTLHLLFLFILINKTFFSLPRKGSERNSENLLHFLFYGMEFRVVFSSAEGFRTEFRGFLFRGTAGIPSEITICSVYSVFRGIIFLSEIPNPTETACCYTAGK